MTKVCAEYIWLGGNYELRSKSRVLSCVDKNYLRLEDIPQWNYDGSSTDQASGEDSEVILNPVSVYTDPFRGFPNLLVMCDTYHPDSSPTATNNRQWADYIFNKNIGELPWYGLEQEYFILDPETNRPIGMPIEGGKQGQYYCSVGTENAFCRNMVEEHFMICLRAGLNISGINAEVAPGQWEFQIGPCLGISAGDQLWIARYLLHRVSEKYNLSITFEPKPVEGDWNGSGCHTNFSTLSMREGTVNHDGLYYIDKAIEKLSKRHAEHMELYGTGNEKRMTGLHETSSYDQFSEGIANRGCSIRRGNATVQNRKGYFEDRRPSSNCDPYLVTGKIFKTICE
jgi:glutamine synthetase